jgi:hypothetical protein
MLLKILTFALYTSPLSVRLCKADHAYLKYLMLQRQLEVLGRTNRLLSFDKTWTQEKMTQFFVATGTFLTCYLATVRGYN